MVSTSDSSLALELIKQFEYVFLIIDSKGIITYASQSISKLNLSQTKILHSSIFDLFSKKDHKKLRECIESAKKEPSSQKSFSFQYKKKKNADIYRVTVKNLLENKKIQGFLITIDKIKKESNLENELNKLKECESSLKKQKDQFKTIIDNANEAICVAQDEVIDFVNPKMCEILQYTEQELLSKPFTKFIHPEDQKKVYSRYKKRIKGEKVPEEYKFRIIDKNGHIHWVLIHPAPFKWKGKIATINFLSDVTEQFHTRQKYKKLFDTAPILIAEIDIDSLTFLSANPAFCKSIDVPVDDIIGKKVTDFSSSEVMKKRCKIGKKAIEEDKTVQFCDQRNGRLFYNFVIPMFTPNGKKHLFVLAQDITDLRVAQQRYRRLIDSTPDAIAEVDGKTEKIITVNETMAENFNMNKESLIGRDWKTLLPPDLYHSRYKKGLKAIKENKIQIFEDKRKDRYFQNIFVPIEVGNGSVNLQIISRDITHFKLAQQKINDSEEKFRAITTSAQDAIIIIDDNGEITLWNRSAERIFGYKEQEIMGKDVHRLLMSEKYEINTVIKGLEQFKKRGTGKVVGRTQELLARKKDGSEVPVELSVSAINIQDQWHAVAIVRDISIRKKMEESLIESREELEKKVKDRTKNLRNVLKELRESEHKYRNLINIAPVGIGIYDRKGTIIEFNNAFEDITGYSPQNIDLSKHFVHQKEREKLYRLVEKNGSIRDYEIELRRKNGERYIASIDVETIQYQNKPVFLIIERDISEIKNAERQLLEIRDFLRNVINSASEFMFTVDMNNNIELWNTTAEQITGKSSSDVIGKNITDLSSIQNTQSLIDYIKNIASGHSSLKTNLFIKSKRNTIVVLQLSCSIIKGEEDKSLGFLVVGRDVTQSLELKEELVLGSAYLQYKTEISDDKSIIFNLKTQGNSVLWMTRRPSLISYQDIIQEDIDIVFLEDHSDDVSFVSSCEEVIESINDFITTHDNSIVLFDRLDYLLMNSSFETVLTMIYKLNSVIATTKAILIYRINPHIFSKRQLSLLEEELSLFKGSEIKELYLEESLYQILSFIYENNQNNIVVSYGRVGKHFDISKVTTGKRISELKRKGLISISLKGRMKTIQVTKKGEDLLSNE